MEKTLIYNLTYQELCEVIASWEQSKFRVDQIWKGLYQQFYKSVDDFSTLPAQLRDRIQDSFLLSGLTPVNKIQSEDTQTEKTLFRLPDGNSIESVLMHYQDRESVCVSTQVGCAMGCTFCATGKMGLIRNLSAGEIVEQVIHFERVLKSDSKKVTNVVLMGMGEPFHNFNEVIKAIDILNDKKGVNLGERRFTISTVGLPERIRQFADLQRQINLAISLHTPFDEKRSKIIPINRTFPICEVMKAVNYYLQKTNRRVTFEYALIEGENDDPETAVALAQLLHGMLCHVNLIPVNPIGSSEFQPTSHQNTARFQQILEQHGIPCSTRLERGINIQAGCGQLASRNLN